ncbi:MAG: tetratricopeptide repeat protein, partial [Epsilonproteobacteria bacterium]|nr:tetratricopeptide repeat protein [Campylobacterota bacterium]
MKKLITLILLSGTISLFSLTIVLNSARENKEDYSILHIFSDKKIFCKKKRVSADRLKYICEINENANIDLEPKKTKLVNISFIKKSKNLEVVIVPKYNVKVFKTSRPLFMTNEIDRYDYKKAKHWIFLLYKNKIFLKQSKNDIGINFPVLFTKDNTPSIGALDPNGLPISYKGGSKDIAAYLAIKDDYDKERFNYVISEASKAIDNFPNSIFLNDFILFKIRAMNNLLKSKSDDIKENDADYNQIIKLGKSWIKKFPSNQNIPEVLYYIANAFQNLGQDSDARYFYDILITEHPDSKYTKLGIISFADSLYAKDKEQKAVKLYKDVLYSAKDIDVASVAAERLAKLYIKKKDYKRAKEYYKKIIEANPKYYLKNPQKAYLLAVKLSKYDMNDLSAVLLEKLLKEIKRGSELKENVLKTLADVYVKLKNKKAASRYYKEYLKNFRYGQYSDEVKKSLDGLFFDDDERNSTKLLARYDKLMSEYKDEEIYQKAGVLKAKLLIRLKRYEQALTFLDGFKYNEKTKDSVLKLKKLAAKYIAEKNLNDFNCLRAVKIIESYHPQIDENQSKNLGKCYIDTNNYDKALIIA